MKLTVFTPAYNRGHTLGALYVSLCRQSVEDFEWLIVDDGSKDDTSVIVDKFIAEGVIKIRYFKQKNGGKHRAINRGVIAARGELFFIVDSDDYLSDNALERILYHYEEIKGDQTFAGVSGLRVSISGEKIGGEESWNILDCSSLDIRYKHKVKGDMAEVVRTDIFKKYLFPDIDGEFFCPEAVVWNRMAQNYKFRHFYEKIYVCEYLAGGLTSKITKLRMKNSGYAMLCYGELFKMKIPFFQKIKAAVNFWRFAFCSNTSFGKKINQIGWCSLPCLLPGLIFNRIDSFRVK